jgi:Tfp pilus assembly protein PilV
MNLRLARSKARSRGYNAVEVLMAMTVFAIGAGGVISMQKTSVQANYDARTLDVATALARTWQERLARDAMSWRTPASFTGTTYLVNAGADWTVPLPPTAVLEGGSAAFDLLGRDVPAGDASMIFCTQIRMQRLGSTNSLVRAEVRVIWPRANAAPIAKCETNVVNAAVGNVNAIPHVLSTVTSVRGNF